MKKMLLAILLAFAGIVVLALPAGAKVGGVNGQIAFSRFVPGFGDDVTYTMKSPAKVNPLQWDAS
jgi:hypothetical protein